MQCNQCISDLLLRVQLRKGGRTNCKDAKSSDQPRAGKYQIDEQAVVVMLSIPASGRQLCDHACGFLVRASNMLLQGFQSRLGWMHLASHECRPRAKNVGLVPAYSAMQKTINARSSCSARRDSSRVKPCQVNWGV